MPNRLPAAILAVATLASCDTYAPNPVEVERGEDASIAHVVHVSIDGLRSDVAADPSVMPVFARIRTEGVGTDNARADPDQRNTLPNHTSQLTGRNARGDGGHGWVTNGDPEPGETLHSNRGAYVASVLDVVHDHGIGTAVFVGKSKLSLFDVSYDGDHGAPDRTGADDGRDKVDVFVADAGTGALALRVERTLRDDAAGYTFVHLSAPDAVGHKEGWDLTPGSPYLQAVARADSILGVVLDVVAASPQLAGRTAVLVTADHGGQGTSHDEEVLANYRIPFYVWGAGVPPGDLYALNDGVRHDPGERAVAADAPRQPVRNADAANVALGLLDLPPVPGSRWGAEAPLRLRPAPSSAGGVARSPRPAR